MSRVAERAALAAQDWSAVSVARRAGGAANIQLRHLDIAAQRLRGAVEAAHRAHDRTLAGEAHMTLASALVLLGHTEQGFHAIEQSLTEVSGALTARAMFQRAAILQELGRTDDALSDLRIALPGLRRAGDTAFEARALSNRSLIYIDRRLFAAAEADLLRARDLVTDLGHSLSVAYIEQNLGSLSAHRGEVATALHHFDQAGQHYTQLNLEVGSLLIDRSKLLLSVRLIAEARDAAQEAVHVFTRQKRRVHIPEAQLMVSTAALLQGDTATAVAAAQSATRVFARAGRHQWHVLARWAQLQAETAATFGPDGPPPTATTSTVIPHGLRARLSRCASDLEAAGWPVPALEAHIMAGRIATAQGRPTIARQELTHAARARHTGPADVRARAWLAEALLRERAHQRRGAKSALRAGIRVVEDYRATLNATELRAHVSIHRGALARAGVRMALDDGNPAAVHWWSERGRASAYSRRPLQAPDDSQLSEYLADLRATMTDIEDARAHGQPTPHLITRQTQLERKIRDHTRSATDTTLTKAASPPSISAIAASLTTVAMVELLDLDGQLHAVSIVDGRPRLHPLGPAQNVTAYLEQTTFALHRLARHHQTEIQTRAARKVLTRAAHRLDELLLAPLRRALQDRPLVIIPTGRLQSVPWSILPSCVGRAVCVSPSAAMWLVAAEAPARAGRSVAIAGPGLSGASAEARAVADLYPGTEAITDSAATCAAIAAAVKGSRLAHIAAHGHVRSDNALFSSIMLADGPFTVYDLERLGRTPQHVILAACGTAMSQVTAGAEIVGFAAALLAEGTATLTAPVIPIPDGETVELMTNYHQHLRAGKTAAEALAAAQAASQAQPRAQASAAGFICLGHGHAAPASGELIGSRS